MNEYRYAIFCYQTIAGSLLPLQNIEPEVGKVSFKSNGDEALSDDSL
jgi:hypothetical protein